MSLGHKKMVKGDKKGLLLLPMKKTVRNYRKVREN